MHGVAGLARPALYQGRIHPGFIGSQAALAARPVEPGSVSLFVGPTACYSKGSSAKPDPVTPAESRSLCSVRLLAALTLLLVAACTGRVTRVQPDERPGQDVDRTPQVLVVTLTGLLDTQQLARCHRTLREAEARGVGRVLFRLRDAGAFGEDLDDLQSLFDHVQGTPVETVALLQGRVTQGAAALALLTTRAYCLPGAVWGEVTKPEAEILELLAQDPDAALAERFDAARIALASRLERKSKQSPLSPDQLKVALAMADPRVQLLQATVRESGIERQRVLTSDELGALRGSGATVLGELPLPRPLVLTASEAEEVRWSRGTIGSLEALVVDELLVPNEAVGELEANWAEHMVGWLEWMQPFLLVLGFLLILFEVKSPGFGLPGILGAAFLGLALFYSYLVGLAEITEILVFFLGLGFLAVEIFVLPGTVVFGAVGFLSLVLALILSQQSFVLPGNAVEQDILLGNLVNLTILFVLVLGLGAVFWRFLPKVPLLNRVLLAPTPPVPAGAAGQSQHGVGGADLTGLVGRTGLSTTVLRPAGAIELDGERIDVVTEGEFLEAGVAVRVLYVLGNRVVVGAVAPDPRAGERGSVGLVLLLAILGLGLLVAEVFFVSFGVIAALSGLALITAVFVAFQESTAFGTTMLVAEVVAAPLVVLGAMRVLPHTRFGKQLILSGPETAGHAAAAEPGLDALLHRTGVTVTALRPAGLARIDGRRIDVITRGEMLDADVPIRVLDVTANRVVVGRIDPNTPKPN
jgi:membrane-bound serine protease (ClpP class)